jgi:hypothetical protein
MRIEHQGYMQVQPTYQHVGYLSAAVFEARAITGLGGAAWLTILLAVSLVVSPKLRPRLRWVVVTAVVLLGGAAYGVWALPFVHRAADYQRGMQIHTVLRGIERDCQTVEEWAAEHGRLPTEREWASPTGRWNSTCTYRRLDRRGADGQLFVIVSRPSAREGWGPDRDIVSTWFGPDALYATPDDDPALTALLQAWLPGERGQGVHGRKPRQPARPVPAVVAK